MTPSSPQSHDPLVKSDAEWKLCLTAEQYNITRKGGTERPFSGPHLEEKRAGTFRCVCCTAPLFEAATKYDSGTGWPSYSRPFSDEALSRHEDRSLFLATRVEVRCGSCDAHLGHVFKDGPPPTGDRYCINGHALTFDPS